MMLRARFKKVKDKNYYIHFWSKRLRARHRIIMGSLFLVLVTLTVLNIIASCTAQYSVFVISALAYAVLLWLTSELRYRYENELYQRDQLRIQTILGPHA